MKSGADQSGAVATWYYDFYLVCLLVPAVRVLQRPFRDALALAWGVPRSAFPPRPWFWPWMVGIVGISVLGAENKWPMKAAFFVSRPAMDRIADTALADPANAHELAGQQAGLFRISSVEVIDHTVVLYIAQDHGFARIPEETEDHLLDPGTVLKKRSLAGRRLADDWFVTFDYYLSTKDWWSQLGTLAECEPVDPLLGRPIPVDAPAPWRLR